MKSVKLSKQEKILLALLELSKSSKNNLKFEDVVVSIFRKFPDDFHLKGYKEYPDADAIRRPLYTFRDQGLLLVRNMIFSLTDKGLDEATKIKKHSSRKKIQAKSQFDRYVEKEIRRIKNLNSLNLYAKDYYDKIFDTDFFDFLGISVKSDKVEFRSRLKIMSDVAKVLKNEKEEEARVLYKFHTFMLDKFRDIIKYKLEN